MSLLEFVRQKYHPLWRLRQQAWFRSFVRRADFPVTTTWGKVRYNLMFLRDLPSVLSSSGEEAETKALLVRILCTCDVKYLFDIGSNIGAFSWCALDLQPDLHVFLFEPDAVNAGLIRRTLAKNEFESAVLWDGVVAENVGSREFLRDEVSGTVGSLNDYTGRDHSLHHQYQLGNKVTVASTTIDRYMEAVGDGNPEIVVKIDVEGAEVEVLRGGLVFIKRYRPALIVECYDAAVLIEFQPLNYTWYQLGEGANLLLVPAEREKEFLEKRITLSTQGKAFEKITPGVRAPT